MIKNKNAKRNYIIWQAAYIASLVIVGIYCAFQYKIKSFIGLSIVFEASAFGVFLTHVCPLKILSQFEMKDFFRASLLLYKKKFYYSMIFYSIYPLTLIYCLIS